MQLQAWRTVAATPTVNPPVHICIAPVEELTFVFPWILPEARAIEIFGKRIVDQIRQPGRGGPVMIELSMKILQ
jgi:hypothetical protein